MKKLLLILFMFLSLKTTFANDCNKYFLPVQKSSHQVNFPTVESVDQKVLAVHLTDYLPEDNLLKAESNRGRFGATTHFALGAPVEDHHAGNWSKRKYAIVVPFQKIKKQIVNINPQDTFILGSLELNSDAIIFIPKGMSPPLSTKAKVIYYEENIPLKVAIQKHIAENDFFSFVPEGTAFDRKIRFGEIDLAEKNNLYALFDKTFKTRPQITALEHEHTFSGRLDDLIIDANRRWLNKGPYLQTLNNVKLRVWESSNDLLSFRNAYGSMNLSQVTRQSLEEADRDAVRHLNLFKVELHLQEKYGKSMFMMDINLNPSAKRDIWDLSQDELSLKNWTKKNLHIFPDAPFETEVLRASDIAWALRDSNIEKVIKEISENLPDASKNQINTSVLENIFYLLQKGKITKEKAVTHIEEVMLDYNTLKARAFILPGAIKSTLQKGVLESYLDFFKDENVQKILYQMIDNKTVVSEEEMKLFKEIVDWTID